MDFEEFKTKFQRVPVDIFTNQAPANPIVSVCVQTYQHVNYIKECLDGILMQQTNFLFEILLGEDGSTDGTREICIEYAVKYPDKIRLFLHRRENNIKVNGIPTGRFNFFYNLFCSKGKYVAICEGDDYWTDRLKLQKQVDFLEKNTEYILCSGKHVIKKNHEFFESKLSKKIKSDFSFDLNHFLRMWLTKTLTVMFRNRKDIFKTLIEYKYVRDLHLFYHLLKLGNGFYFNDQFGVYNIHEGGIHSMKGKANWIETAYVIAEELWIINRDNFSRKMFFTALCSKISYEIKYKNNYSNMRLITTYFKLTRSLKDVVLLPAYLIYYYAFRV